MSVRAIDQVLPHAGRMIWLDRIVVWETDRIICERTVRAGDPQVEAAGLPTWTGVELMAQAIAAWNGCRILEAGGEVRPGFLLGTRQYRAGAHHFPLGAVLRVEALRTFHDEEGMGAFTCTIDAPDVHAEARLTVFSPTDPTPFLDPRQHLDPRGTAP